MFTKRGYRVPEEAAALRAGRHPGVVELVDATEDVLRTHMVDARPVGELVPLAAAEVAGLAAAVATTLADLHDLGVVHGGIDPSHVLLTAAGRPVLCSLGRGGEPTDDVAALGLLMASLLSQAPPEHRGRGLGRARPGRRQLGPMLAPPAGPSLLALATEAMAPDPATRPTARALADTISRHIPAARLPCAAAAIGPVPSISAGKTSEVPLRGGRAALTAVGGGVLGLVAVAAVLAGVTVAGGLVLSRNKGPGHPDSSQARSVTTTGQAAPGAPEMRATTSTAAMENTRPEPRRPAESTSSTATTPATTAPAATQVWPLEPLELNDGVLTFRGSRYAVGRPGDAVVAGDWACTGEPSLALLRRDTGHVFAFDGWPSGDGVITARPLARVEGATDLRVTDGEGAGCHALEVERQAAPPVRLRVGVRATS
ncbi:MAG TPA: hypothetical protein VM142_10710 [Acidimicrobiales bacterium]|nr:hypothetical protein [Acidimicrobiales bacterium]